MGLQLTTSAQRGIGALGELTTLHFRLPGLFAGVLPRPGLVRWHAHYNLAAYLPWDSIRRAVCTPCAAAARSAAADAPAQRASSTGPPLLYLRAMATLPHADGVHLVAQEGPYAASTAHLPVLQVGRGRRGRPSHGRARPVAAVPPAGTGSSRLHPCPAPARPTHGRAPRAPPPPPQQYFPARGRGETIRLALAAARQEWFEPPIGPILPLVRKQLDGYAFRRERGRARGPGAARLRGQSGAGPGLRTRPSAPSRGLVGSSAAAAHQAASLGVASHCRAVWLGV
jgi:hypothetical protein